MNPKLRNIFIVLMSSLLLYSCSDDPTSAGLSTLPGDDLITLKLDSASQQSSSFYKTTLKMGTASTLLLGKSNNVTASVLIKFNMGLPDSTAGDIRTKTVTITGAHIEMSPIYKIGGTTAPFDFTVNRITKDWTSNGFDADSLSGLGLDMSNLNLGSLVMKDSLYKFNFDPEVIKHWLADSTYTNYGIFLTPTSGTQRLVGFQAYSTTYTLPYSYLVVDFQKKNSSGAVLYSYSLTFSPSSDTHIVTGNLPSAQGDNILIQGGLAVNSVLKFNLPEISTQSIINNAELELTVDSLKTVYGAPATQYMAARFITDPTTHAYDSVNVVLLTRTGNLITGNIRAFMQRWVNKEANNGIVLSIYNQESSVDLLSLKGSSSADRPRLKVTYTTK